MNGLDRHLDADKFIVYADDSYVFVVDASLESAKTRLKTISQKHFDELRRRSMIVNNTKTEIVVFTCKGVIIDNFQIGKA